MRVGLAWMPSSRIGLVADLRKLCGMSGGSATQSPAFSRLGESSSPCSQTSASPSMMNSSSV